MHRLAELLCSSVRASEQGLTRWRVLRSLSWQMLSADRKHGGPPIGRLLQPLSRVFDNPSSISAGFAATGTRKPNISVPGNSATTGAAGGRTRSTTVLPVPGAPTRNACRTPGRKRNSRRAATVPVRTNSGGRSIRIGVYLIAAVLQRLLYLCIDWPGPTFAWSATRKIILLVGSRLDVPR